MKGDRGAYVEPDVLFDNDPVRTEFLRWKGHFGSEDPYQSGETVGLSEVLRAHFLIVDYFYSRDAGLGGIGPKHPDLLHSAIYRQFVSFGGVDKWSTPFDRAATLLFGIVTDHPFHDANKRTGLLVLLLFLKKIGRAPLAGQKELEDFAVEIADHQLDRYPRYRDLAKHHSDPEVAFISDYLRRKSRKLDKHQYAMTFRELDRRLGDFGYRLANPSGNYIDVVRVHTRRKLWGLGQEEKTDVKVIQVGFPGWKSQVTQTALASIRRATKLTADYGIDSRAFYQDADPVNSLIAEYAAPLERLAYR